MDDDRPKTYDQFKSQFLLPAIQVRRLLLSEAL